MAAYDSILSKIKMILPEKPSGTTNTQLERLGKQLFGDRFRGVFAADQIPKLKDSEFAIANTAKNGSKGVHWLALIKIKDRNLIYDSFGRVIRLKGVKRSFFTDPDAEQLDSQNDCGQRALAFIVFYLTYGLEASLLI